MTLVLDTHVLYWLLTGALDQRSLAMIEQAEDVRISSLSFYELWIQLRRGRLGDVTSAQIEEATQRSGIAAIDPSPAILRVAAAFDWQHLDPFDRIIVATLPSQEAILLTADKEILGFESARTQKAQRHP